MLLSRCNSIPSIGLGATRVRGLQSSPREGSRVLVMNLPPCGSSSHLVNTSSGRWSRPWDADYRWDRDAPGNCLLAHRAASQLCRVRVVGDLSFEDGQGAAAGERLRHLSFDVLLPLQPHVFRAFLENWDCTFITCHIEGGKIEFTIRDLYELTNLAIVGIPYEEYSLVDEELYGVRLNEDYTFARWFRELYEIHYKILKADSTHQSYMTFD